MRILVVSNLFPPVVAGGYEVECAGVVRRLREHHEVLVLTSVQGAEGVTPDPGVRRALPWVGYATPDALRAPLTALRGARVARGVLAEFRPDLVFVWNGAQLPHSALAVLHASGVPLAYRVCEWWFSRLFTGDVFLRHLVPGETGLRGVWARAMRLANRHPDLRLDATASHPASLSWCSAFLRRSCPVPAAVTAVHQETVLSSTDHSLSFLGLPRAPQEGVPVIAFVGRVDERKGVQVAVEALARLQEAHGITARLELAGRADAAERAAVAGQAAARGVGDRVSVLGPLDGAQLRGLLTRAHAWVVPSVWEEPLGLVALEAGLAGVPAVVSRAGGLPEILGDAAWYFERGDAEGCARALADVLGDPEAAAARSAAALARATAIAGEPYLEAMERFTQASSGVGRRTA